MNVWLRLLTSLVLIAAISWLLWLDNGDVLKLVALILAGYTAFEWGCISGLKSAVERWLYVMALMFGLLLAYQNESVFDVLMKSLLPASVLAWVFAAGLVVTYKTGRYQELLSNTGIKLAFGALVVTSFWLILVHLYLERVWLLVILLASGSAFDSFAYFVGRWKGRYKLCPDISPGKTWEGLVGGAVMAVFLSVSIVGALIVLHILEPHTFAGYGFLIVISVFCAQFGDLVESLVKRAEGIKHSGTILPGHGGLLDRCDSHLAAFPVCVYLASYLDI